MNKPLNPSELAQALAVSVESEVILHNDLMLCKHCNAPMVSVRSSKAYCNATCRQAGNRAESTGSSPDESRRKLEYWDRVNYSLELYHKCKFEDRDQWLQSYIDNPMTKWIVCNPELLTSSSNNIAKICHHYVMRTYGVSMKSYYPA